jgi:hypothetical protein
MIDFRSNIESMFLYRAYSAKSVGKRISGKGQQPAGSVLDRCQLLREFNNHRFLTREVPTALVSTTCSPVLALKRAFATSKGQDIEDTGILIIQVPADNAVVFHHAQQLAEELKLERKDANLFKNEFLFEWEIPRAYVKHEVSLATLCNRGMTPELIEEFESSLFGGGSQTWDMGVFAGLLVKCFGARASFIGANFWNSCKMPAGKAVLEGIETAVLDWWLLKDDILLDYQDFCQYRDMKWDRLADLYSDMVQTDPCQTAITARRIDFEATVKDVEKEIEDEAIRIGL